MARYLFVQPHPDDLELNCAHLIHYLSLKSKKRHEIRIASITKGEFGLPGYEYDEYKGDFLAQIRVKELQNAVAIHGISPEKIDWLGYIDGFVEFNTSFVSHMAGYLQNHQPDTIVAPEAFYTWYYHKDHVNTGKTIYYIIINKLIDFTPRLYFYSSLSPNFHFPIDPDNLKLVDQLIECHKTQQWLFKSMKRMIKPTWLLSGLNLQGFKYAEPYRRVYFDKGHTNKNQANYAVRGLMRLIISKKELFDAQYPEEVLKKLGKA